MLTLEIVNCPRVYFSYLASFVEDSYSLKELILHDCTAYDRELFVSRLLGAVFALDGRLRKFCFSFSEPSMPTVSPNFQPDLNRQNNLEHLDISNNSDLKYIVRKIVVFFSNLVHLNIIGLPVEYLNLFRFGKLNTFKASNFESCIPVIRTLRAPAQFDLTIIGSPLRDNQPTIMLEALKPFLESVPKLKIQFSRLECLN